MNPIDVLRQQSEKSREMHEQSGAPLIKVPVPEKSETLVLAQLGLKC